MKKPTDTTLANSAGYRQFVEELKARVASARLTAARRINHEMILLYWDIGRGIVEKQKALGWGESVVEMVAADLRKAFPAMSGFSARNVWSMRRLYEVYSDPDFLAQLVRELGKLRSSSILPQAVAEIPRGRKGQQRVVKSQAGGEAKQILLQPVAELEGATIWPQGVANRAAGKPIQILHQLVAEIPWGHHLFILDKLTEPAARLWYLRATARFGWSRNVLLNQIKAGAYERAVTEKKTHNFELALPEHFAEQADEMLKSSYNLEFLGLRRAVRERELEDRLVTRLQAFLLDLGRKEYFIDLLFYHRFLKALVAFDLKVGPFEPEFAGKMDFYLNLLNDKERGPDDQPSIGIILCAVEDEVEVEYVLRSQSQPDRRRRLHLAVETSQRAQWQTPHRQTARRGRAGGDGGRKMSIGSAHLVNPSIIVTLLAHLPIVDSFGVELIPPPSGLSTPQTGSPTYAGSTLNHPTRCRHLSGKWFASSPCFFAKKKQRPAPRRRGCLELDRTHKPKELFLIQYSKNRYGNYP
jgi:predicted nuclease of restriction endonuclease-like (RecB) superfamily